MDKNRVKGAGHEMKGAAKEALGKVTGNIGKQAQGLAEKSGGRAAAQSRRSRETRPAAASAPQQALAPGSRRRGAREHRRGVRF